MSHLPERTTVLEPSTAGRGGHRRSQAAVFKIVYYKIQYRCADRAPEPRMHTALEDAPQHPRRCPQDLTPRTTPAPRGRQWSGDGKSPPTRRSGCLAKTSLPQGLKSTSVGDNPARWDRHAGRQVDWPTRRCQPLLLIPGLQLFSRVAQEDVIFLLGIIELMSLGPVVAGGVGEDVAVVVEAAGCYRLV